MVGNALVTTFLLVIQRYKVLIGESLIQWMVAMSISCCIFPFICRKNCRNFFPKSFIGGQCGAFLFSSYPLDFTLFQGVFGV